MGSDRSIENELHGFEETDVLYPRDRLHARSPAVGVHVVPGAGLSADRWLPALAEVIAAHWVIMFLSCGLHTLSSLMQCCVHGSAKCFLS